MNALSSNLLLLVTTVFCGALLGTAVVRHLAWRYGWVVLPREDRWHKHPTALHGGIGFYPAFVLGTCWVLAQKFDIDWRQISLFEPLEKELGLAIALLVGSLVMLLFGLWDDVKQFRPATKLLCQLTSASVFIFAGGVFPLTGFPVVDIFVTYFWFIGITNAINMLDNMDGLSSGVVIVAGTTLAFLAMPAHGFVRNGPLVIPLSLVFVSALLGFWFHNRPPARIFMGDSGSLFIGYVLAAMAVPSSLNDFWGTHAVGGALGPILALLIPSTVLAVPIFDTTLVTITRKWRAEKASQGGRDHSSHRLVGLGLSEKLTVWVLYSFAIFGGIISILVQRFPEKALPLFGIFVLVLILSGVYLGYVKVRTADPNRLPPVWTPLVTQLLYKRHAAEILLDTVLVMICFDVAYLLRFDGVLSEQTTKVMIGSLPIAVASCLVSFFLAGIYRGQWRLISVSDLPSYAIGTFGGVILSLSIVTLVSRFEAGHSRSAFIIFGLLLFLAVVGARLSFRVFDSLIMRNGKAHNIDGRRPVLIYGAAKAGKILHEEMTSNPEFSERYCAVGFVDDDPNRTGRKLCGIPIKRIEEWVGLHWKEIPEIWISSRFIPDKAAQELLQHWRCDMTVRRAQLRVECIEERRSITNKLSEYSSVVGIDSRNRVSKPS